MKQLSRNIRVKLGNYRFMKDLKKIKITHEVVSLDAAEKVGLLYDATDEKDFETVKNYVKQFRSIMKKDILAMGYVDKKELPQIKSEFKRVFSSGVSGP